MARALLILLLGAGSQREEGETGLRSPDSLSQMACWRPAPGSWRGDSGHWSFVYPLAFMVLIWSWL